MLGRHRLQALPYLVPCRLRYDRMSSPKPISWGLLRSRRFISSSANSVAIIFVRCDRAALELLYANWNTAQTYFSRERGKAHIFLSHFNDRTDTSDIYHARRLSLHVFSAPVEKPQGCRRDKVNGRRVDGAQVSPLLECLAFKQPLAERFCISSFRCRGF